MITNFKYNFSNVPDTLQEIDTIARLARLNSLLGKDVEKRTDALAKMTQLSHSLLTVAEEFPPSHPIKREMLERKVGDLTFLDPDAKEESWSIEKIKTAAQIIQQDAQSLLVAPIKRPNLGLNGPTFLIDYARPEAASPSFCSFVMKKTDYAEVIPNLIYHEFARWCEQVTKETLFASPHIAILDLTANSYRNSLGQTMPLVEGEISFLHDRFSSIAQSTQSTLEPLSVMMLADKVQGQNLLDFLSSKRYTEAPVEQKADFFFKVGMVSMLDLVVGNFDRFIAIETELPKLLSDDLPANLGNALVVSQESDKMDEHFSLFAIDNGIDPMLREQEDSRVEWMAQNIRKEYNKFLTHILSDPDGIETLLDNIVQALTLASTANQKQLPKEFLEDLDNPTVCHEPLEDGMIRMGMLLQTVIIPYWNSPKSSDLKEAIRQHLGGVLAPLDERLALFGKNFEFDKYFE